MDNQQKRRAFFSVWHKIWQGRDIVEIARVLAGKGWEIEASGGTCKHLRAGGITCLDIADRVGEPILGHRVVTLSREFMAGLLATDSEADRAELVKHGIPWIDMVVCNFYPLGEEIAKSEATPASVIEKTDIGGPTMVRAAAKGRRIVVCDPNDYAEIITRLELGTLDDPDFVGALCAKAEYEVTRYTMASAGYHGQGEHAGLLGRKAGLLKYGENPYMEPAALYACETDDPLALHRFRLMDGGQLPSMVGVTDYDRLLQTITHIAAGFDINGIGVRKIAVVVKHGNACGAAVSDDPLSALKGAIEGDLRAIMGGVLMTNFAIGVEEAEIIRRHKHEPQPKSPKRILDGVVAPAISEEAQAILERKEEGKCRCMVNPALAELSRHSLDQTPRIRPVRGGFIKQPNYTFVLNLKDPRVVIHGELSDADLANIILAWAVCCTSTSNTMAMTRMGMLIGNGVGQQDRVGAAELVIKRARDSKHDPRGATVCSDSFPPFADAVARLVESGVRTIFTSSGGMRMEEIIACCKAAGTTLVTMPDADCRGFYGH